MRHPATVLVTVSACCYLITALVGVWAAYDRTAALTRLGVLLAGLVLAFGVAWAGRRHAKTVLGYVGLGSALVAAGIALVFVVGLYKDSGAAASSIMVLLPLGLGGFLWYRICQKHLMAAVGAGALAVGLLGLVWSLERTAWIGLVAGVASSAYLYRRFRSEQAGLAWRVADVLLAAGIVAGLIFFWQVLANPKIDDFLRVVPAAGLLLERIPLWRESLALIQDYRYSGSGLGSTAMVYSTYILLLHVPFFYHAHNLYLQIAIEQGIPGLLLFLCLVVTTLSVLVTTYRRCGPNSRLFCLTTLSSFVAALVYGFLDAELYATVMAPMLFLPFGCALALHLATQWRQPLSRQAVGGTATVLPSRHLLGGMALLPLLVITALFLLPDTIAKLNANFGAVAQTRAELSLFRWPEWPLQDQLRRQDEVDLTKAYRYYRVALAKEPGNVTAHERLGQIALSQGDYEQAQKHLETVHRAAPERSSVRQMLGEVYAVTGNIEAAAALWQTIDTEPGQLAVRLWWYDYLDEEQQVYWIRQTLASIQF